MKSRILVTILFVAITVILSAGVLMKPDPQQEFLEKRAALVVRDIGHRLLLHGGDAASRVLPVKQLNSGIFQLRFEHRFAFIPDTLVKIVQYELASGELPLNYMINVFDCATGEIVYGFEIGAAKRDIVPCLGRVQPKGCYTIQVAFLDLASPDGRISAYYLLFIPLTGLMLFLFIGRTLNKTKQSSPAASRSLSVGKYFLDVNQKKLTCGTETIELSGKETRVLEILAAKPNELVDREYLLSEVWENEGVITGRSLDVFISKLRKKLIHDASIRISNIHGRGYKLEIT